VINDAIDAYQAALKLDPNNAQAWAELARIQTYSSSMLRNDTERLARLKEAKQSADQAVQLAPDDSTIRAIRAFVLDWYAYNPLVDSQTSSDLLVEAEREASRAFQLDPNNALALAFYAEILADQQKWTQAEKYASQAVSRDPSLMDTHRVYAYVMETLGLYNKAIEEYQRAADLTPNLTFLYIRIGQNYREGIKNPERALEYFDRAARINSQLGVQNPLPYIEIAKTYTQQGQFFIAGVNAEKALSLDNQNAHTYGQLGIIFRRARNYEGAMPLLKCAVRGCTAAENEMGSADVEGLPLTSLTIAYYYVEYGTNLAFLSRATENYCQEAYTVLEEVRRYRPDDATLIGIIDDSEGICRRLEGGSSLPASTSTPTGDTTPTPTPDM
jgi:tetratricopeptide (TPR) repeat protein